MNRRSLLLGSVVASVAGVMGVKAPKVETATESVPQFPTLDEYRAMCDEILADEVRKQPWFQAQLRRQVMERIGIEVSGYGKVYIPLF